MDTKEYEIEEAKHWVLNTSRNWQDGPKTFELLAEYGKLKHNNAINECINMIRKIHTNDKHEDEFIIGHLEDLIKNE